MIDLNVIRDNRKSFTLSLKELPPIKTIMLDSPKASTLVAKEYYDDINFYLVLNLYNNRNPIHFFKEGEVIKLPDKISVLKLLRSLEDKEVVKQEDFTSGL